MLAHSLAFDETRSSAPRHKLSNLNFSLKALISHNQKKSGGEGTASDKNQT